ncbi:MAG TPA: thiol:disulfide interchange protein DsbA/DsbL [Pseudomonadales bacterium]|nr:thiol:disulfide interchange protein DsbA/DsbL [Pseudomonadales bacterium]
MRLLRLAFCVVLLSGSFAARAKDWQEGKNYFVIEPARFGWMPSPGKVEVTEVFSYACPACNAFYPYADKLKASLPPQATMTYLPASFIPQEDWPMFQRAWCTAHALGIAEQTHDTIFRAVWATGQLATMNPSTRKLMVPLPTIKDAAHYYSQIADVSEPAFLAAAQSFTVNSLMRKADHLVMAWKVSGTPTIVIDGKYRMTASSAGGVEDLLALVDYLVKQEIAARAASTSGQ